MVADTLLADVVEEALVAVTSEVGNCACSHMTSAVKAPIAIAVRLRMQKDSVLVKRNQLLGSRSVPTTPAAIMGTACDCVAPTLYEKTCTLASCHCLLIELCV